MCFKRQSRVGIAIISLVVGANALCAGDRSDSKTQRDPETDGRRNHDLEFGLLEVKTNERPMPGAMYYLQETKQPTDRLLLAVVAPPGRSLMDVWLELRRGKEIVFPFQRLHLDVLHGRMAIREITLDKKVITNRMAWERHARKQGTPLMQIAEEYEPITVSNRFAVIK